MTLQVWLQINMKNSNLLIVGVDEQVKQLLNITILSEVRFPIRYRGFTFHLSSGVNYSITS